MISDFIKPLASASYTPYSRHDSLYESASSSGQQVVPVVALVVVPPEQAHLQDLPPSSPTTSAKSCFANTFLDASAAVKKVG